ncbi:MAG: hypothetical protein C0483_04015 [Pirellula sp.]|nr:hypothetical protein [Pirellula sp.]
MRTLADKIPKKDVRRVVIAGKALLSGGSIRRGVAIPTLCSSPHDLGPFATCQTRLAKRIGARVDPDDAVQSAFRSFFIGARTGKFTLNESDDLWRLLATITARKVARLNERHSAAKRSVKKEQATEANDDSAADWEAADHRYVGPVESAVLAEELSLLMAGLKSELRSILELRLQDESIDSIAERLGKSPRTIRRRVEELRQIVASRMAESDQTPLPDAVGDSASAAAHGSSTLSAPSTSIDYHDLLIQSHLGSGGVGKVYRAWRRSDGATFALKVLKKKFHQNRGAVAQFLEESQIIAGLNHPGIVNVYGLGKMPGGGNFFLMDLLPGPSLGQVQRGSFDSETIKRWLRRLIDALLCAHERGVVHCDLKPSNVLLNAEGEPVIVDFGFATSARTSVVGATPAFAAPELLEPRLGVISSATDVWGIGAILYWLIFQKAPRSVQGIASCLEAPLPRTVDQGLCEICRLCLQVDPSCRPALEPLRERLSAISAQ